MRLPPFRAASSSWGKVAAALRSSALPALIPPMSGSANRSTMARPSRPPTIPPTDSSSGRGSFPAGPRCRWGRRSSAIRSDSPAVRIPERATGHHRVGTPRFNPGGIGRNRPRAQTDAPEAPTGTNAPLIPSSAQRSVASGRRARKASAPRSTVWSPNGAARSLPPRRLSASNTWTSGIALSGSSAAPAPRRSSAKGVMVPEPRVPPVTSSQAAASPAMPPPTTATTGRFDVVMVTTPFAGPRRRGARGTGGRR